MIKLNEDSHLLEQTQYKYSLQDVTEPNLFRDVYEYTEIPKIVFNQRRVPIRMPEKIWITDTTFRDGQQALRPYTAEQIVDLYKMLHRLGGEQGIIRQSEFFVYSEKDRRAVEMCQALGYEFPEITTWIRAKKEDFALCRDMGIKETGILVSCSDYHIFKKLGMSRSQALNHYLKIICMAFEAGITPRCHLEDITRADFYGFVVPFVNEIREMADEAKMHVRIRMCDTMGYGVPFSGAALPRSVPGIIYGLNHYAEVPGEWLEWHGHNDFYLGVANACTAWLYGASAVNCSLLGIGERTGNIPLEAMCMQYAGLRGTTDGMDLSVITEIAEYYEQKIGYPIPPMTPFVGKNFNVTRAGIHADGLLKDEEIYNIFDTQKILNRPVDVSISANSGLAGIAYWVNHHYKLDGERAISKHDPLVLDLKEAIDAAYADGRLTVMTDGEMEEMIRKFAPDGVKRSL